MAINLFNYTNQKLNAEQFRVINGFNSFNYAGILGEKSPFEHTDTTWTLKATEYDPVTVLGGGLVLNITGDQVIYMNETKRLVCLCVKLDPEQDTIITDATSNVFLQTFRLTSFTASKPYTVYTVVEEASGDPSAQQYYTYNDGTYSLATGSTIDENQTYYIKYESSTFSFKISSNEDTLYHYNGNTLWLYDDVLMIPLLARWEGDEVHEVVRCKSLKDLAMFLSMDTYNELKAYCEGSFVWSTGGMEEVIAPDGTKHRKGDIGNLNITGSTIMNMTNRGTTDSPSYPDPVSMTKLKLTDMGSSNTKQRLYFDSQGNLQRQDDYMVSLADGGVYDANNWDEEKPWTYAKSNLHIRYGDGAPSSKYPSPVEGDIYIKIIE